MVPVAQLQKAQRTIREARLLAVRTQEAVPELTDDLGEAITRLLAAEQRSAKLLKERMH